MTCISELRQTDRVTEARNPYRLAAQDLRQRLTRAAAADGLWGYYPGQTSRIEPTCWALMALKPADPLSALQAWQRNDGLLVETNTPVPNYAWNGLALLALSASSRVADAIRPRLIEALLKAKGVKLAPGRSNVIRQNNALQAWSWIDGTFSWSEPTGWCLLALKKTAGADAVAKARIAEAEALLLDRMCQPAGWNYGNAAVFTQDLRPYVPTTALALLAMQNRTDRPEITRSLDWLEAHATDERSAMGLALAAICLHVFKRSAEPALTALVEDEAKTGFLGNAHLTAMALYALTIPQHDAAQFRIP